MESRDLEVPNTSCISWLTFYWNMYSLTCGKLGDSGAATLSHTPTDSPGTMLLPGLTVHGHVIPSSLIVSFHGCSDDTILTLCSILSLL